MQAITIGTFELSLGVIIGLILFSFTNAIGAALSEVYFKPWLYRFKNRHDKMLGKLKNNGGNSGN